jgi:hypothetical protein
VCLAPKLDSLHLTLQLHSSRSHQILTFTIQLHPSHLCDFTMSSMSAPPSSSGEPQPATVAISDVLSESSTEHEVFSAVETYAQLLAASHTVPQAAVVLVMRTSSRCCNSCLRRATSVEARSASRTTLSSCARSLLSSLSCSVTRVTSSASRSDTAAEVDGAEVAGASSADSGCEEGVVELSCCCCSCR